MLGTDAAIGFVSGDAAAVSAIVMFLVALFVGIFAYFLPSFVAVIRGHHNVGAIVVLNFFLGWTFLGWVAALVWACTEVRRRNY